MTAVSRRLPGREGSEPFLVQLDRFQGPLDLLLHLIRSQDIDIFDIPIARITHQFHRALESGLDQVDLDRAGEFLELAATLVRIKAQLLLPRHGDDDWDEDPRAELVRRLLEYELFQEVARLLSDAEADRRRHLGKGYLPPRPQPEATRGELTTTLEDFLEVALAVPEPEPETTHVAPVRVVTVEEKIESIERHLTRSERLLFSRLFESWLERPHVVAALLACLEMAKQQLLRMEQVRRFGSIWLFPGPGRTGARVGDRAEGSAGTSTAGDGPGAAEEAAPDAKRDESAEASAAFFEEAHDADLATVER